MKLIQLTQNQMTLVDDEDYEYLVQFKWYCQKVYKRTDLCYARLNNVEYKRVGFFNMHSLILKTNLIDHIDGNGLNNQKNNLRICSHTENIRNQRIAKNNQSGYKGVSWVVDRKKWRAGIEVNGRCKFLGHFLTKEDAARAYNEAALKYFGEFARLNVIS